MIHNKAFTGRLVFQYRETTQTDRSCSWTERHYEGGVEVIVPEQRIVGAYGLTQIIPEHTEFLPLTEDEGKHLKYAYDKIKKRIKSELNK